MIVVRNIFRLKFGQSPQATQIWKNIVPMIKKSEMGVHGVRLLTDLAGAPFYTIVLETTHETLADFENAHKSVRNNAEWKAMYEKLFALTEDGRREILTVIE